MNKKNVVLIVIFLLIIISSCAYLFYKSRQQSTLTTSSNNSYQNELSACNALPNNSTQQVVGTTRLFINLPKDIYPHAEIINPDFSTVSGNATGGYVSNGGLPGYAEGAISGCWSTYIDIEGSGEVDLKVKSEIKDTPDYFVRFIVSSI